MPDQTPSSPNPSVRSLNEATIERNPDSYLTHYGVRRNRGDRREMFPASQSDSLSPALKGQQGAGIVAAHAGRQVIRVYQ